MATKKNQFKRSSLMERNLQMFLRNKLAVAGFFGMVLIVLACVFAPLLTNCDPTYIDPTLRNAAPSLAHPLGCDTAGRDLFARILYGGRWSILIGVSASVLVNSLGCLLGCIAGYYGGMADKIIVALSEFLSIFPSILVIMLVTVVFGGKGLTLLLVIWTLTGWGGTMRIIRGRVLSLKQEPFVESCRVNGISSWSIMFHHMIPNTMGPLLINMTMNVAGYMLQEAGLSYLGVGVPDSLPTWGNIINAAKRLDIIQNSPMLWVAPGVVMCALILCVNFFGDGLRDALDPTSK